ncbi:hypothetical protein BN2476_610058 [Paraburkholderia piptadeniae]|uniref:Uncharacterized protein n=1 Tax=Paraburkholderia piptadeniae TaxID=1701573 RepID=A0A1N7SLX9_9BURK|nr:hypothetical protein BN2476_610058 [Paraburkholderia piptadeniae]
MTYALIVDDDPDTRDALAAIIADEGLTTATADELREAHIQLVRQIPDFVLKKPAMPLKAARRPGAVLTVSMDLTVVAFQPRRNITLAVEHAPDFDVSLALNVEDQVRIAIKRPRTQARDVQLVRVTGRPDVGVPGETLVCLLDLRDESERCLLRAFVHEVVRHLVLYVLPGQPRRDDGLGRHLREVRTRARNDSK